LQGRWIGPTYSYIPPPPPGYSCIDIKKKDLQIGMLEVVENKGANSRLKSGLMRLKGGKERFGRGVGQDKHNLVYHIFTGCQMISCKYRHLNELRRADPVGWRSKEQEILKRGREEGRKTPNSPPGSRQLVQMAFTPGGIDPVD
jgi:hypothetical protein